MTHRTKRRRGHFGRRGGARATVIARVLVVGVLSILAVTITFAVDLPAPFQVVWTREMSPAPGAFFRHLPGTRVITFDQSGRVSLVDLDSGEEILGPGFVDFVPTPDGRIFVTPGDRNQGLEFYLTSDGAAIRGGALVVGREAGGRSMRWNARGEPTGV